MKKLLAILVLVLACNTSYSQLKKITIMHDSTLTPKFNEIFQDYMYYLLDSFRVVNRLKPLKVDSTLEEIALQHSKYQDYEDTLTHNETNKNNPYYTAINCYERGSDGENCVTGSKCIPCPELMAVLFFKSWLSSDGHRKNMLNNTYTHCGVAIYDNYATLNFKVIYNNQK